MPERISIVGCPGNGKSTVARAIAARLALPHVELDAIFHQPGWEPLPAEEFRRRVGIAIDGDRWVVDGNYSSVLEPVWERADTVVWLDLPRRQVMRRVVARTLAQAITRRELWNGNREPVLGILRWDPRRSIIRWTWTRHATYRERYGAAMADPRWERLAFVRLTSAAAVRTWLDGLEGISSPEP